MLNEWQNWLKKTPISSRTPHGTGLILLNTLGLLGVSGEGAFALLQGQLTCDLRQLTTTKSSTCAMCTPKGRVICYFRIMILDDHYFLLTTRDMLPLLQQALQKYAVFYKVRIWDASDEYAVFGVAGQLPAFIKKNAPTSIDEISQLNNITLIHLPSTSPRYLLMGKEKGLLSLWHALTESTTPISFAAWHTLFMEDKIPIIHPETSEMFLPHELGLQEFNAIHFDKGCYTGQEIIARMHYRGKTKTKLYRAKLTTKMIMKPGDDIYSEKGVSGTIVDVCELERYHYYLLILANANLADNDHLFVDPHQKESLILQ